MRALLALGPVRGVLCTVAFYTTVGVFEAIWAVFLDDLGASQRYIALTLTLFAIPMLFVPIYGGRLAQRLGPLRVGAWSLGAAIPFMMLYGELTDLAALGVLCVVHAIADSFTMPSLQLGIAQLARRHLVRAGPGRCDRAGRRRHGDRIGRRSFQGAAALFSGSAAIMLVLLVGDSGRAVRSCAAGLERVRRSG